VRAFLSGTEVKFVPDAPPSATDMPVYRIPGPR
jgi:hypothetical protein